jgi:signal transduction histidine kinase
VGQMKLINSVFELQPLFLEIYDYYVLKKGNLKNAQELTLTCSVADNAGNSAVYMDKQRLKQLFTNLLDNAFKFTQTGNIDFGCEVQQDTELLCWVKDSGIGIPEDKQVIIFDRFRQADDFSPVSQYSGTGLGLSIVQGIISLMSGKIWVESKVGEGTTFYFTLPMKHPRETDEYGDNALEPER